MERDTRIQHFGEGPEELKGSATPPVFRTSLFTFPDVASFAEAYSGKGDRHLYTRVSNPTTRILEKKVADLEEMENALAFSSGMAAVSATLLGLLSKGNHMIMTSNAYGPTLAVARGPLKRFGIEVTFLPPEGFLNLESHIKDSTRLIYLESPASLTFEILDVAAAVRAAQLRGVPTIMDNSWATPIYQKPGRFGCDISLHSGTKYINGHSDILLGLVAGRSHLLRKIHSTAVLLGGTLSPADAFLAIRGLRTLPLRMERHQESALALARYLENHPGVEKVLHPGLPSFPGHELARSQMQGWSGLFSFVIKGDARRFTEALNIFKIGISWGGFESLVAPVAGTFPEDPRKSVRPDLPDNLIRISVGLEDPEDLIGDLERGLEASG